MRFDMKAIGERVQQARENMELHTMHLASRTGINTAQLRDIELGQEDPRLSTVLALANALGVSVAWLIGEVS